MINDVISFDIEVFPNLFLVAHKDFRTKEIISWEISEERDERKNIYDWYSSYNGHLISFNGVHYDEVVVAYFIKNWNRLKNLSISDFCLDIKKFSNLVIDGDNNFDKIKEYKWFKKSWISIDLFCYWSKMLRVSKKISLKSLAVQLGYKTIQELPYPDNTVLNLKQIQDVRRYNNQHDLGILDLLAERMREDIKLRINIKKEYGLECLSWDAIKIASEALLSDYCRETGKDIDETRKLRFQPSNELVGDILGDFNPKFELDIFKRLYSGIVQCTYDELKEYLAKEVVVIHGNTSIRLSYGIGGLHSVNENEIYESSDKMKIITSDVASLYPNLIINYLCVRFPEVLNRYIQIKSERLIAKKEKQKLKDTFLKLILNGISGLLDNTHSWLYYPEGALRMRVIGQLIMTKVIEVCLLNNWQVISANTDGIEVIVPVEEVENYYSALSMVEKQFNLQFEHENYKKIVYTNVNNYICQTEGGKLKKKGFYKTKEEIPLGDAVNELIVSKALQEYFINNVPVEKTITDPNNHIYDYCCSKKVNRDYEVFHNGTKVQNLNRYYFSNPCPFLFKRKKSKGGDKYEHMHVGDSVELFNEYKEMPFPEYNINYKHYIRKCNEIIKALEIKKTQLSLF